MTHMQQLLAAAKHAALLNQSVQRLNALIGERGTERRRIAAADEVLDHLLPILAFPQWKHLSTVLKDYAPLFTVDQRARIHAQIPDFTFN